MNEECVLTMSVPPMVLARVRSRDGLEAFSGAVEWAVANGYDAEEVVIDRPDEELSIIVMRLYPKMSKTSDLPSYADAMVVEV